MDVPDPPFELGSAIDALHARAALRMRDALRPYITDEASLDQALGAVMPIVEDFGGSFSAALERNRVQTLRRKRGQK